MKFCENIKINGENYSKNNFRLLAFRNSGVLSDVFTFLADWNLDSNAIFQETSGSTGTPKLISLKKEMMLASAETTCLFFSLNENSKLHLCLPATFVAGKMMILRAIVSGGELITEEPSLVPLKRNLGPISFSAMTPVQFSGCYKNDVNSFKNVDVIILGGGKVSSLQREIISKISPIVYATYGMTETASHVAIKNLTINENEYASIGDALFSIDKRNCLAITSNSLGVCDLQTNDIVDLISTQKFKWKGRADRIINSGGVKISPESLEQEIGSVISLPFFVYGIPNEFLGEELCIAIQSNSSGQGKSAERNEIQVKLSSLDLKLTPKKIFLTDSFIYTKSGKVDRLRTIFNLLDAK